MGLLELSPLSVVIGVIAMTAIAFIRFHFPFRYHYFCYLVKQRPKLVNKLLLRSYKKNKTAVGLLDKATCEMMDGAYDDAEKYLLEGIQQVLKSHGMQNRVIRNFFFNHLSWLLYYKGSHRESLEIALRLYEKAPSTPHILALISCNFARIGEVGQAIEAFSQLSRMEKESSPTLLTCRAEIEAAKGNPKKAVKLFHQAKNKKSYASICFIMYEIEQRIGQLTKTA
ncbi:hypothetical protein BEP19_00740 [Ammoniphilus oxalaticus]|uniref:Tetratricopeptide repeat protein n=1 Tax=Ammoniphilus oxalaticus TaxID=66863 RepID=A0A419SMH2_9BACL|nr:hypothetical protein [Ammoniphilus oxalaticus]RKD25506.1 hypothetical protein BEP19_00740 [Ammoniphilus oxalaticus]